MAEDEILVISEQDDFKIVVVQFQDGLRYKLQHPGTRTYLKWKQSLVDLNTKTMNLEKLVDLAFKYCVFPEEHGFKPTLDTIHHKHLGAWTGLLTRFLNGELESLFPSGEGGANGNGIEGMGENPNPQV